jgi:predicted enzyme related to lactoylglutathione lyase
MTLETKIPSREATGTSRESLVAGVALFSDAPADLAAFYEQVLRTRFTHRVHEDGREHWISTLGGVKVEIKATITASGTPTADAFASEDAVGMSRSELSFQVSGVAATAARATIAGGRVLQPAHTYDWGTFAVVLDPDSNRLGLFEPPTPPTTEEQA